MFYSTNASNINNKRKMIKDVIQIYYTKKQNAAGCIKKHKNKFKMGRKKQLRYCIKHQKSLNPKTKPLTEKRE